MNIDSAYICLTAGTGKRLRRRLYVVSIFFKYGLYELKKCRQFVSI